MPNSPEKFCIIGAGASGLAAAKNFGQWGISYDCFEREDNVGGNWYYGSAASSLYNSTHLISSKRLTEYSDFPMPREYPPYPNHRQALAYLRDYANHFHLAGRIQFNTSVQKVSPQETGWEVTLANNQGKEETRRYRGIVICNGHHWDPILPALPGKFAGETMHAKQYHSPDQLRGKRVLVMGAGNTGCDIAVEAAQNADQTFHSLRRGYHFLPKFLFGKPVDAAGETLHRLWAPLWLQRIIARLMSRIALGPPSRFGLPKPNHKLFEAHPIVNSQLLYYVGHGDITIKPDVQQLCHNRVRFADGSEEAVDLIIYATGYRLSFPFIAGEHLNLRDGRPQFYLNAFHPNRDDIFIIGMIQPNSGLWGLADLQAKLASSYIAASDVQHPAAAAFRKRKQQTNHDLSHGIRYVDSIRHQLEVEYFSYRQLLRKLIAKFPAADSTLPQRVG